MFPSLLTTQEERD